MARSGDMAEADEVGNVKVARWGFESSHAKLGSDSHMRSSGSSFGSFSYLFVIENMVSKDEFSSSPLDPFEAVMSLMRHGCQSCKQYTAVT